MTEKPAPDATSEVFIPVRDLPSAPIIFFEFCPTYGNHNGLINIMLAAGIVMPSGGPGTDVVPVAVAHLRCTAAAAIQIARCHRQGTADRHAGSKSRGQGELIPARHWRRWVSSRLVSSRLVSSRTGTATIEIRYACRPRIDGKDERHG